MMLLFIYGGKRHIDPTVSSRSSDPAALLGMKFAVDWSALNIADRFEKVSEIGHNSTFSSSMQDDVRVTECSGNS